MRVPVGGIDLGQREFDRRESALRLAGVAPADRGELQQLDVRHARNRLGRVDPVPKRQRPLAELRGAGVREGDAAEPCTLDERRANASSRACASIQWYEMSTARAAA